MSYAEEVAPEPTWGDEGITIEACIRSNLAHAQEGMGRAHALMRRAFASDRTEAELLAYVLALHTWLWQADSAALLMRIQRLAPTEEADAIAAEWIGQAQSGDYYPEMLWDWCTERGIDPKRLSDEGAAAAVQPPTDHADGSTT